MFPTCLYIRRENGAIFTGLWLYTGRMRMYFVLFFIGYLVQSFLQWRAQKLKNSNILLITHRNLLFCSALVDKVKLYFHALQKHGCRKGWSIQKRTLDNVKKPIIPLAPLKPIKALIQAHAFAGLLPFRLSEAATAGNRTLGRYVGSIGLCYHGSCRWSKCFKCRNLSLISSWPCTKGNSTKKEFKKSSVSHKYKQNAPPVNFLAHWNITPKYKYILAPRRLYAKSIWPFLHQCNRTYCIIQGVFSSTVDFKSLLSWDSYRYPRAGWARTSSPRAGGMLF